MKHLAGLASILGKNVYASGQAVLCTQAESRTGRTSGCTVRSHGSQVEVWLIIFECMRNEDCAPPK